MIEPTSPITLYLVYVLCAFLGLLFGALAWLWRTLSQQDARSLKAVGDLRDQHGGEINDLKQGLADLRVKVAEDYVSISRLSAFEHRIEDALAQMRAEFGRGFDQLIKLVSQRPED